MFKINLPFGIIIIIICVVEQARLMNESFTINTTEAPRVYSPVTLNNEWPKLERLVSMVLCACVGTTMNGFFVASFFVEHTLKRIGNVYLACVGMADMIVTTSVMPIAAVVLLSGQWDTMEVCYVLQYLTEASTYCYSLFFMLVAGETFYRFCRPPAEYNIFMSLRIGFVAVLTFVFGFFAAGIGLFNGFDYDYCGRKHYGNLYFRITTTVAFHVIPALLTMYGFIRSAQMIKKNAREHSRYKRSQQFERDVSMTNTNITAFLFYVIGWIPYLVVIYEFPATADNKFYHCAWIGVCRSVVTSFLYTTGNRNFRRAFAHLFNYCCCKSTLSGSFTSRHRRAQEHKPADVRVHIMHQAVAGNQRIASSSRETQEL